MTGARRARRAHPPIRKPPCRGRTADACGKAIEEKGGKGTLFAQDYAARVAEEMGADIVKLHEPTEDNDRSPEPYRSLKEDAPALIQRVVRSAGRVMVLFSGGVKQDDDARVLSQVKRYMDCGATGVMFGRNMWLRPFEKAVALSREVHGIMAGYPLHHGGE